MFQREDEKSNVGVELNKDLVKVSLQVDAGSPSNFVYCCDQTSNQMRDNLISTCLVQHVPID